MATPLAGRPPFATDQPDSVFADQPKPTPRPRKQNVDTTAPGGARDSAYTAFDSYFTGGNAPDSRASGVGDIGRGLMDAGSDFDDSSDDEKPQPKKQPQVINSQPSDKHRALYAAATGGDVSDPPPPSYEPGDLGPTSEKNTPASLQPASNVRTVKQPQAVVHARSNDWHISQHLEPSTPPGAARSMAQEQRTPPALRAGVRPLAAPAPSHPLPPQAAFMQGQNNANHRGPPSPNGQYFTGAMPVSPTTRTPQPLPPPQSPIMPVFARPRKESNAITFEEKGGILRGNSEETLLARGTGGKGDDFWRRFSMVAKEEARGGSKKSAWLKKTENGTTRLSTWVWITGILFLIAIGGGIGVGWYFTHNKPASQPVAIGGSANEGFTSTTSSSVAAPTASVKATKVTAAPVPTNTSNNNKRGASPVIPPAHRRSNIVRMGY